MNCPECKENLNAYLDGELEAARADAVARHTRECAACARELESLRRLTVGVAAASRATVPDGFVAAVRAKIAAAPAESLWRVWLRELLRPEWNWQKVPATVAALVIATAVGLIWVGQQSGPRSFVVAKGGLGTCCGDKEPAAASTAPTRTEQLAQHEVAREQKPAVRAEFRDGGLDKDRDAKVVADETVVAKAKEKSDTGQASPPATATPPPPEPIVAKAEAAKPQKALKENEVVALDARPQPVGGKATVLYFEAAAAQKQLSQVFACTADNPNAAAVVAAQALDRCGGRLLEVRPAPPPTDVPAVWAQVPTEKVQTLVNELSKAGEVRVLPPQKAQLSQMKFLLSRAPQTAEAKKSAAAAPATVGKVGLNEKQLAESEQILSNAQPLASAAVESRRDAPAEQDSLRAKKENASSAPSYTIIEIQFQKAVTAKARFLQQQQPTAPPTKPAQKKG